MEKTNFKINIYDEKTHQMLPYVFVCDKSKAKHKQLKEFARGKTYWFEELKGADWGWGGFYDWHYGFINPHVNLKNNVQGVVYQNEVYLLRAVIPYDGNIKIDFK